MNATTTAKTPAERPQRLLTIGNVCRRLKPEFPDISISKIRYLEDQGLLTPKRTQGGYRLFDESDVERLQRILQLQRDEFLPLRVIREELASPNAADRKRRRLTFERAEYDLELSELCERAGITPELAHELESYGILIPETDGGVRRYAESDAEIAHVAGRLASYGISPRHLRTFQSSAHREAALLEAVVAPALRARTPERRRDAVADLRALGTLAQELSQLLLWRELRDAASV